MTRTATIFVLLLALSGCYREPFNYDLYQDVALIQVKVKLHAQSKEQLEAALHAFADGNGYKLRVARVHPTDPQFSIMMWRSDSMILAANPFGTFAFSIFPAKQQAISRESAEMLASSLTKLEGA